MTMWIYVADTRGGNWGNRQLYDTDKNMLIGAGIGLLGLAISSSNLSFYYKIGGLLLMLIGIWLFIRK